MSALFVGLCEGCRHRHWIVSGRGSRFLRCERSFTDPAYARYPQLPVFSCPGFEARGATDGARSPSDESAGATPIGATDPPKGDPDDR